MRKEAVVVFVTLLLPWWTLFEFGRALPLKQKEYREISKLAHREQLKRKRMMSAPATFMSKSTPIYLHT